MPESRSRNKSFLSGLIVIIVSLGLTLTAAGMFRASQQNLSDAWGPFETASPVQNAKLSDYLPKLKGSGGDTGVFILEGKEPGGTALVLGGTHGDEAAGVVAATIILENAVVQKGRLIVIPRANASAATHTLPQEGHPSSFEVDTPTGKRVFRFGSRATNPIHQWPDPEVYLEPAAGQVLAGTESRNLNRAYPGDPDRGLTQQLAYAITELIKKESVDLAFDLHEASPEYPVVNAIVAHPKAMDLAATSAIMLEMEGVQYNLEVSPENLRGLSHREWGEFTEALPILMETANPVQGRLRGRTDAELVVEGKDPQYEAADEAGYLYAAYPEEGYDLNWRTARHVLGIRVFLETLTELYPDKPIIVNGIPGYDDLISSGVGAFLAEGGSK